MPAKGFTNSPGQAIGAPPKGTPSGGGNMISVGGGTQYQPTPPPPLAPVLPTPPAPGSFKPPTRVTETHSDAAGGGKGGMVFFLGLSLMVASGITSGLLSSVFHVIGTKSTAGTAKNHQDVIFFLGEFLFVFALAVIGDMSDAGGTVGIALLLVLWLVWATNNNVRVNGFAQYFTKSTATGT